MHGVTSAEKKTIYFWYVVLAKMAVVLSCLHNKKYFHDYVIVLFVALAFGIVKTGRMGFQVIDLLAELFIGD